jgi:hypothetical protein
MQSLCGFVLASDCCFWRASVLCGRPVLLRAHICCLLACLCDCFFFRQLPDEIFWEDYVAWYCRRA